jgi:hypothetical protein
MPFGKTIRFNVEQFLNLNRLNPTVATGKALPWLSCAKTAAWALGCFSNRTRHQCPSQQQTHTSTRMHQERNLGIEQNIQDSFENISFLNQ